MGRETADSDRCGVSGATGANARTKDQDNRERLPRSQNRPLRKGPAAQRRRGSLLAPAMARRRQTQARDPHPEDRHPEKPDRGERMTKNKNREGPLPPPDKGVNDARPGLPNPTVRKNVTWVQPEPTTSDITRPQQLSPDTTWAEPSTAKSKLAKGSPGLSTTRDQTKE